jgi:hypothetical protein
MPGRPEMSDKKDTRKPFTEEPPEDLELKDEDAEKVAGGDTPTPSTQRFDPYKNFKFHV